MEGLEMAEPSLPAPARAVCWLTGTQGCLLPVLHCRAGLLFDCCFSGESSW